MTRNHCPRLLKKNLALEQAQETLEMACNAIINIFGVLDGVGIAGKNWHVTASSLIVRLRCHVVPFLGQIWGNLPPSRVFMPEVGKIGQFKP